jgi:hypothetical protein
MVTVRVPCRGPRSHTTRRAWSTPARASAGWGALKPAAGGTNGDMREQARIARTPIEFDVAASSYLENTSNVRHGPDTLKAVFTLNFTSGMLEVHAGERFNEYCVGVGVVNEQRTNRTEEL